VLYIYFNHCQVADRSKVIVIVRETHRNIARVVKSTDVNSPLTRQFQYRPVGGGVIGVPLYFFHKCYFYL